MPVEIDPIHLENVADYLGLSLDSKLVDCVNASDSSKFDPDYQSSSDPQTAPYDLLDFRNYGSYLTADPDTFNFDSTFDSGSSTIDSSTGDYSIDEVSDSWISASHADSSTLYIEVESNDTGSDRYGYVNISNSHGRDKTVNVNQSG